MKLVLHADIDVLHIEVGQGEQAQTLEASADTFIDIDAEGRVLAVEILNAREFLRSFTERGGALTIPEHITDPGFRLESMYSRVQ